MPRPSDDKPLEKLQEEQKKAIEERLGKLPPLVPVHTIVKVGRKLIDKLRGEE